MRRLSVLLFGVAIVGLLHAPAFGQAKKDQPKDKEPAKKSEPIKEAAKPAAVDCCGGGPGFKNLGCHPLVFVVNGEANSTHASDNLQEVSSDFNLRLRIVPINWSRYDSHNKDAIDIEAQMNTAARLACTVKAIRKESPNAPIFFVGFSGGAHIVLRAAEMLPEKSVDRIIVIAPTVSSTYDLTRALKGSRGGIDNFYSNDDSCLEHMAEHVGTADGAKCAPAGLVGFRPICNDKKEMEIYRNVRQYRWSLEFCGGGGHYTWTRYHNLKKTVAPMFFAPTVIFDGPAAQRKMPPAP